MVNIAVHIQSRMLGKPGIFYQYKIWTAFLTNVQTPTKNSLYQRQDSVSEN